MYLSLSLKKKKKRTFSSSTTGSKARLASVRSEFCASDGNLNVRSHFGQQGRKKFRQKVFQSRELSFGRQFIVLLPVSKESIDDERSNEQFEDLCRVQVRETPSFSNLRVQSAYIYGESLRRKLDIILPKPRFFQKKTGKNRL